MTDRADLIRQLEASAADLDGISQEKLAELLRLAALKLRNDEVVLRQLRAGILEIIDVVDTETEGEA